MIYPLLRKLGGAAVLALLVLALAGCGRRGPLEAPEATTPDSQASSAPAGQTSSPPPPSASLPAASLDASANQVPNAVPAQPTKPAAVTPVYKSFFLNSLIN